MKVPLLDLSSQYKKVRKEVLEVVKEVCDSQHYVLGKNVSGLESEIAAYCGTKYAIGVASGTDAILLSLMAAGVSAGDKVVTSSFTFFATVGSIVRLGAVPVFADIDPRTFNIDPDNLENLIKSNSKGIKAVMPIHLYGQCADMAPINELARKYGLAVIEDAAQSIGAEYRGRRAGSMGSYGCFSFYPTKNLGGMGDGGMITTNNKRIAEVLGMLRVHGSRKRYYHDILGTNSRLDELQAAVLRVKLKHLDGWTKERIVNARRYDALFEKSGLDKFVQTPYIHNDNRSVYNQYVIRVKKRDALRKYLANAGIGSEVYYPVPMHQQKCFKGLGYGRGSLPVTEKAAREVLALPIYAELKPAQQRHVVDTISTFYKGA